MLIFLLGTPNGTMPGVADACFKIPSKNPDFRYIYFHLTTLVFRSAMLVYVVIVSKAPLFIQMEIKSFFVLLTAPLIV